MLLPPSSPSSSFKSRRLCKNRPPPSRSFFSSPSIFFGVDEEKDSPHATCNVGNPNGRIVLRRNRYRNRRRDGNNSSPLTMLLLVGTRIRSRGGQRERQKQEAPVPASQGPGPGPGPGLYRGPAKLIRRSSEGDGGASES